MPKGMTSGISLSVCHWCHLSGFDGIAQRLKARAATYDDIANAFEKRHIDLVIRIRHGKREILD